MTPFTQRYVKCPFGWAGIVKCDLLEGTFPDWYCVFQRLDYHWSHLGDASFLFMNRIACA